MSIQSILVPLDGSRFAEAALPCAVYLAQRAHASIRLVLVHERAPALVPLVATAVADEPREWAFRAEEASYLSEAGARQCGGVEVECEVREGHAAEELARVIEERAPDLVVMATHGRGSVALEGLGSVADYLLRSVHVPLLLVHPAPGEPAPALAPPCPFRAALVPVDFSEPSLAVLDLVASFAPLTEAHITLLHVVPALGAAGGGAPSALYVPPLPQAAREAMVSHAQRRLDGLADELRSRGLRVAARVLVADDVAGEILRHQDRTPADFLVIATHGTGGYRERLIGSVSDKLIRGSAAPVLILRPPG